MQTGQGAMNFGDLTASKELKLGTCIGEFATPGIGALLKTTGVQFVFVDMEHSAFSFETVKALLRSLHDVGLATLVRPPSHAYHHIARACDVGAQGVVPPMMGTAEQAQAVIDAINYPPKGKRGAAFGIAHDDYVPRTVVDAIENANARTSFVALIETAEGIENVEAIAALDGCDCLWIGHFDLSNSLGIPGEFDNPEYTAAVDRVLAAGKAHGKSVGQLVPTVEEARLRAAEGYDVICYSGDVWIFRQAMQAGMDAIRNG